MFDLQKFNEDCLLIREESPLIHNITNYVAMDTVANALLSVGASPIMSAAPEEMIEIVSECNGVAINIGTPDQQSVKASRIAAAAAKQFGKPWVLDPVGAGFTNMRTKIATDLALNYSPTIIRGNASEIISLAIALDDSLCADGRTRGVDSHVGSGKAIDAAMLLARISGAVVSVSGEIDYITDGLSVSSIENGSPIMPKVTALGCTATAITAAFASVDDNPFSAALNAMALMGVCGEICANKSEGTGSFRVQFMDILSSFRAEEVGKKVISK